MADGADPHRHRATGAPPRRGRGAAPPRRGRGTPLRAGEGRAVAPLTAEERLGDPGNLAPITNRFAPLRYLEDVAAGPDPPPPLREPEDVADLRRATGAPPRRGRGAAPPRGGRGAVPPRGGRGPPLRAGDGRTVAPLIAGERLGLPRFGLGNRGSSSAAPSSSDHPGPGPLGRIRVRQSVLYSDRPRHSRPRRLASSEASGARSSKLHRPVMDVPTFEELSLGDPSLSTPETAVMTNVDYAPRSEQEERTCVVNSSEVDREVIEALSLEGPPLQTRQTETDEESTDDDCAWVPPTRQTEFFFNRPKGISRSMVLSTPLFITVPNVKEDSPKLYSDVDPEEVKRSIKEYLDARPYMNLRATSYNILDVEDPTLNGGAAELGTESQLPNVITQQASVAAAHPRMVPTESRHEASAEENVPTGTAWMEEEVMLCFKKLIAISRHLAELEDYHLDELQHQCFNVESYDKVYHHYNFTVRVKMAEADWKVKLYFAEVKEVFRKKYYLCYPLDPNENGQCYACKNQGVEDLRHPAIDLYEMGSPDVSCSLWYTDDESDEEPNATRFESDSFDLGVLFSS